MTYGEQRVRLIEKLLGEEPPRSVEEKRALALRNGIALWDTIYSCDIRGSSDSSIRNVVPTDLRPILEGAPIRRIFCNGRTSGLYYKKYQEQELHRAAVTLPSTSPANAAWTMERLKTAWSVILEQE